MNLAKFFLVSYLSLFIIKAFSLENLNIMREDQTFIDAYLTIPENTQSFPLILLIQGSDDESVINNHNTLAERFNPYGIAMLSIEKRGIHADSKDPQEFIEYDFFESRFKDFSRILYALDYDLVPQWNGVLIVLAGSEGGKIAPRLSLQFPSHIAGVILIASGGGIPFSEEMKFQIETILNDLNPFDRLYYLIRNMISPQNVDAQCKKILENPVSHELWYGKTFCWWASYLKYDPLPELLQIKAPIYMIHGVLDSKIPVKSADAVKTAFDEAGKYNLTYARYMDLEHTIKGRNDVYQPLTEWIKQHALENRELSQKNLD